MQIIHCHITGSVTVINECDIMVTNLIGHSVSLWKAADLSPLGSFPAGVNNEPYGACNDGVNFWVTLSNVGKLARF